MAAGRQGANRFFSDHCVGHGQNTRQGGKGNGEFHHILSKHMSIDVSLYGLQWPLVYSVFLLCSILFCLAAVALRFTSCCANFTCNIFCLLSRVFAVVVFLSPAVRCRLSCQHKMDMKETLEIILHVLANNIWEEEGYFPHLCICLRL